MSLSGRLTFAAGLVVALAAVGFAHAGAPAMAAGDYWIYVDARAAGSLWTALWTPNEYHLMALPRLIFAMDEGTFQRAGPLVAVVAFGSQAAAVALAWRSTCSLAAAGWALLLAFFASHLEVFTDPQKLWLPLCVGLSVGACFLAERWTREARTRWLAAALGCAVAASLTGLPGLFSWPGILVAAGWRAPRRGQAAVAVVAATVAVLFFSRGGPPPQSNGVADVFLHFPAFLASLMQFLGSPFGRVILAGPLAVAAVPLAVTAGVVGFGLNLWLSLGERHGGWRAVRLFVLLWAASVAFRDFQGDGPPFLSRYDVAVSWFWIAAAAPLAMRLRARLSSGLLAGAAFLLLPVDAAFAIRTISGAVYSQAAALALSVGVADPALERHWLYRSALATTAETLRRRRLPPFARDWPERVAVPDIVCGGQVSGMAPLPDGGMRLWGQWPAGKDAISLLVVDGEGRVTGRGVPWIAPEGAEFGSPGLGGWLAYAAPRHGGPVHVIALTGESACRFRHD